jgi:beta-galactosidase
MKARSAIACIVLLAATACIAAETATVGAWIEAENYAESNFRQFDVADMGKAALLSGGKVIMKGIDAKQVGKLVPDDGIRLKYAFDVKQAGKYDLWVRIGWYGARADCRLRVGDGPWLDLPRSAPTINLMELGFFCEVSWAKLEPVSVEAGKNVLEVQFPKVTDGKSRMLCALDCFALIDGHFTPEGPFKPGETYDGEADRAAANQVFELPTPKGTTRTETTLNGPWQVARYDDPDMDADTTVPVQELPSPDEYRLRWMGFDVPGNPWEAPPLVFGHRLIYRTRVRVPAAHRGRGFKLHFSGTNWIVSVFVNGRLAGTHRGVWVPWDLDVSRFIQPGKANEIAVAVKGTYYALDAKAMGGSGTIDEHRNRPLSRKKWTRWVAPIYPSTKGDGDGYIYGIVNPVTLVSAGDAYTEDVFVKPSVQRKELGIELTVRNTTDERRGLEAVCEAVHDRTGEVEKKFTIADIAVPAGETVTVKNTAAWANPKLWWPEPNPHLYRLRTTLREKGQAVDVHEQLFGFREVTVKGPGLYINGVRRNFWNWVDVARGYIERPEQWAEAWRTENNRFMRFSHGRKITTALPTREQRLEFYDRHGIPGRLCTMIDGMFISYKLGQRTREEGPGDERLLKVNEPVWDGFRRHMAQVAKAYRNHPSVIFYQIENELVYINGMNIYGGYLDQVEREMMKVHLAGREHDPTRPYSVGGGGDLRHAQGFEGKRLEINCPHYPRAALDVYPDDAYQVTKYSSKIERWPWDRKNPWMSGESLYAAELALGSYAAGPIVYRSQRDANRGKARFVRAMYEGYRWAGVAGFFPWCNLSMFEDGRKVFSPLTAIPRKRAMRLYGGKENRLHFKVMNDTLSDAPVTFAWAYTLDGQRIAGETTALDIEPGFGKEQWLTVAPPAVDARTEGALELKVSQAGAQDFTDSLPVPAMPSVAKVQVNVPVAVYDKSGKVAPFLAKAGIKAEPVQNLTALDKRKGLLIIGPESLTADEAFGGDLLKFAVRGNQVIVLEQDIPVAGANLSAPLRTTTRFGGYAHPQALGTPVFGDLGRDDLIDWAGEHPTYKCAYVKPSQGGRSLVECGPELPYSALVELGAGQGVMVLCQLRVGAKLGTEPAADVLLRNLVEHYAGRTPSQAVAAIYAPDDPLLAETIAATGALTEPVDTLAAALNRDAYQAAVIDATEANLAALNRLKAQADAFQTAGGWIMLCGVRPESIEEFNTLLGTDHLLRPFRIERVFLQNPHHPLAATLSDSDMALYSTDAIAAWKGIYWVSPNTFSYVIDGRDAAPFTYPPGAKPDPYHYQPKRDDKDPYNFVNGLLSSDFWRYIRQIWVEKSGAGRDHTFRLRQPETLRQVNIWNNAAYSTIEKLDIIFDGNEEDAVSVTLPDAAARKEVPLPEPRTAEETITLRIKSWRVRPHKHPKAANLVGIDNVEFIRAETPSRGIFLDSAGGLVVFPRGKGGVLLNQVKVMKEEPRKSNGPKKVALTATLLQNMGVGSAAASVAVPGYNVRYEPVDITDACNVYRTEQEGKPGWFGRRGQDLRALQKGKRHLGNVLYHVVDYQTAPVPDCIVVSQRGGRQQVRGIPVGGKRADVLFFLHAADVRRPITERERQRMHARKRPFQLPTLATYVLHYADGQTADMPVVLERHVDHWLQETPQPLPAATVAWDASIEGAEGQRGVLYTMKARNPRPDVPIKAIDVMLGQREKKGFKPQRRASVGLLAITLGRIIE